MTEVRKWIGEHGKGPGLNINIIYKYLRRQHQWPPSSGGGGQTYYSLPPFDKGIILWVHQGTNQLFRLEDLIRSQSLPKSLAGNQP